MRSWREDEIRRLPLPPEVFPKTIGVGCDERDCDCGGWYMAFRVVDVDWVQWVRSEREDEIWVWSVGSLKRVMCV